MEIVRLKNFNPENVAPNFLNFLRQRGKVEIGNENKSVARCGISNEVKFHRGLGKPVRLNSQEIGTLETYIDPPAVVFQGILPDVPKPKGRGPRPNSQTSVDADGRLWTHVMIGYHGNHPKAYKVGRIDGWTTIPLP